MLLLAVPSSHYRLGAFPVQCRMSCSCCEVQEEGLKSVNGCRLCPRCAVSLAVAPLSTSPNCKKWVPQRWSHCHRTRRNCWQVSKLLAGLPGHWLPFVVQTLIKKRGEGCSFPPPPPPPTSLLLFLIFAWEAFF